LVFLNLIVIIFSSMITSLLQIAVPPAPPLGMPKHVLLVFIMTQAGTLRLDFPAFNRRIFIATGLFLAIILHPFDFDLSLLRSYLLQDCF